ncbi:NADH-quinone oxidoreductase subunit J [candidate division KSB1 bacterium]|nr:NADH-quinone oxidoreductase subunit J [candidate division KSB1 bacterium]MBL7093998.1 NADH-quinone oxidoreductase subunit J [candidate division KSB1 bacterium]
MDFNILMYFVFGMVAIAGGLVLLFAKHPIKGAMGLLVSMLALAGLYAILQAHSIAVFQVIIYAGAIMVLIIYFLMLLDIKSEDYLKSYAKLVWTGGPILLLLAIFFIYKLYTVFKGQPGALSDMSTVVDPMTVPESFGGIKEFSTALLTKYMFAFEFVSTLLFAAIVAVISIVQLDWRGRKND